MVMVTVPQVSLAVGASKAQGFVHSTVLLPTQVMTGLVVSTTVMVCTPLVLLPRESVAVQRRVITRVPPQALVIVSLKLITTAPQLSWAVAVPVAAGAVLAPHSTVRSGGQVRDAGGV